MNRSDADTPRVLTRTAEPNTGTRPGWWVVVWFAAAVVISAAVMADDLGSRSGGDPATASTAPENAATANDSNDPEDMPPKLTEVEGISQYELDNGVDVLLFPDESKDVVTVNMTVFVGSRHEGYGEAGMAHLLEHMLFKGTPDHPNVPKSLQDRGARFNGTTWVDRTNYYETLPASDENLRFALELEADRLVNSYVKGEDLASEMTVVRNEFESGENSPIRILMQRMQSAAYDWHNYGQSTIGNRSDIERVPVIKLRDFYRKYYRPDNVMLVVAGKFDPQTAMKMIRETFGSLPKSATPIDPTYTVEPPKDGERTVVLRRVGDIQYVGAAYHIPAGSHPEFAAAKAITNILGDEPTGRLYRQLVEPGMASNVFTLSFAFAEPGMLMAFAEVPADQSIEQVRQKLLDVVERDWSEDPVTDKEVSRAVDKLLKARELEASDTDKLAVSLSEWAAQGDWRLYFLFRDALEDLTAADVQAFAEKYFRRNNRTVGLFIPSEESERITIPEPPDVEQLVANYTGREAVAAGEAFDPTPEEIERRTLRGELVGGIEYALLPKKTRGETVNLNLTLRFGDAESLKGRVGAAELLGILMARGTKELDYTELQDELTRLRADLSVYTTVGLLQMSVKTKREFLSEVVDLMGDVLRQPALDADELEVLRRQIVTQLSQSKTEPQGVAPKDVKRRLSPFDNDHVLYVPTFDEEIEMYESVTADDIRQLYEEFIGNHAGEFVAVGDFDANALIEDVREELAPLTSDRPYVRVDRPANPDAAGGLEPLQTDDKANAFYYASQQYDLSDADPMYAPLVLGNHILGAGALSSRLGDRVRGQDGLSYGIRSGLSARSKDDRVDLTVYAITNPDNKDKLIAAIGEELHRLIADGVTETELSEAKEAYLQAAKVGRSSDGSLAGLLLGNLFNERTMEFTAEFERRIADATVEQVNEAIRKYIEPDRLVESIAGDFDR